MAVSENVGNQEIYSVRLNGTRRRDLSRSQGLDAFPSVSPNRKLIAYESIEPQPRLGRELIALKVMRPDGTGKRSATLRGNGRAAWRRMEQ